MTWCRNAGRPLASFATRNEAALLFLGVGEPAREISSRRPEIGTKFTRAGQFSSILLNRPSNGPIFPANHTQRRSHKAADKMAEFNDGDDSDVVTMSQELNIGERSRRSRDQRGRGRGEGKGERGGRDDRECRGGGRGGMKREVAISKALSKLLRHAAEDEGLALDGEGFARVDQVVSLVPFLVLVLPGLEDWLLFGHVNRTFSYIDTPS